MHDPVPLVKSVGYGSVSKWLARRASARVKLIAHSEAGLTAVLEFGFARVATSVPHPVLPADRLTDADAYAHAGETVVRVLGQYKADRDVDALAEIARSLPHALLEIHGRRWPEVEGWRVFEGFVDEDAFGRLIASSAAIVVPYRRFFQSGVAIRAIENGIPVIGPAGTSLDDLLGANSPLVVKPGGSWPDALRTALSKTSQELRLMADEARERSVASWRSYLSQ